VLTTKWCSRGKPSIGLYVLWHCTPNSPPVTLRPTHLIPPPPVAALAPQPPTLCQLASDERRSRCEIAAEAADAIDGHAATAMAWSPSRRALTRSTRALISRAARQRSTDGSVDAARMPMTMMLPRAAWPVRE
jgi:hypothetical protein